MDGWTHPPEHAPACAHARARACVLEGKGPKRGRRKDKGFRKCRRRWQRSRVASYLQGVVGLLPTRANGCTGDDEECLGTRPFGRQSAAYTLTRHSLLLSSQDFPLICNPFLPSFTSFSYLTSLYFASISFPSVSLPVPFCSIFQIISLQLPSFPCRPLHVQACFFRA